jgi:hypothetical protein
MLPCVLQLNAANVAGYGQPGQGTKQMPAVIASEQHGMTACCRSMDASSE